MDSKIATFQGKLFPFLDTSVYLNILPSFELKLILLNFLSVNPPVVPWRINPFSLFWLFGDKYYDFSDFPFLPSPSISFSSSVPLLLLFFSWFQLVGSTGRRVEGGRSQDFCTHAHTLTNTLFCYGWYLQHWHLFPGSIIGLPGLPWFQLL